MNKKQKKEKKKILSPIAVKILFFMVGLFISVAVAGVYAAWNSTVSPGDTITASGRNEIVAKLVELNDRMLKQDRVNMPNATCYEADPVVGEDGSAATLIRWCDAGYYVAGIRIDDNIKDINKIWLYCCKPW